MSSKSQAKSRGKKEPTESQDSRKRDDKPPIEQPTPIVITGGSPLTAISEVVQWGDWTDIDAHHKRHPLGSRKITRILIQDDNNPATPPQVIMAPSNGKVTITVVYEL
jgi:hypothetical protein